MSKQFWGVIVVVCLVFVGIFMISSKKTAAPSSTTAGGNSVSQHVTGKGSANVTLVEFGDYQCPFCEEYSSTVKAAVAEFNDQITFQFRNYPLTNLHPNAFAAARAAEAAALQNKFWEMHDTLYEAANWQVWKDASDPTSYFQQYAKDLGLDTAKFKTDFSSDKVNDIINADQAAGNKLNVTGTPTFFINGKKVSLGNDLSAFEKAIKAAIAKKPQTSSGTTTQTPAATPPASPNSTDSSGGATPTPSPSTAGY